MYFCFCYLTNGYYIFQYAYFICKLESLVHLIRHQFFQMNLCKWNENSVFCSLTLSSRVIFTTSFFLFLTTFFLIVKLSVPVCRRRSTTFKWCHAMSRYVNTILIVPLRLRLRLILGLRTLVNMGTAHCNKSFVMEMSSTIY